MLNKNLSRFLLFFIALSSLLTYFYFKANPSIRFDNEKYNLAYSKILHNGNTVLNEYIIKNDNINDWDKLISVNYFPNQKGNLEYLSNLHIESVKALYKNQFQLLTNNRNDKVIIKTFIIVNRNYTEYNAIGYTQYKNGYYFFQFAKKYRYNNLDEVKAQSMKLLQENSKYAGLIEGKITNFIPKPLFKNVG